MRSRNDSALHAAHAESPLKRRDLSRSEDVRNTAAPQSHRVSHNSPRPQLPAHAITRSRPKRSPRTLAAFFTATPKPRPSALRARSAPAPTRRYTSGTRRRPVDDAACQSTPGSSGNPVAALRLCAVAHRSLAALRTLGASMRSAALDAAHPCMARSSAADRGCRLCWRGIPCKVSFRKLPRPGAGPDPFVRVVARFALRVGALLHEERHTGRRALVA